MAREIDHLARLHGLDMAELESCPLRDFGTLDCLNDLKPGQQRFLTVYNPNLETAHGLIVQVDRKFAKLKVGLLSSETLSIKEPDQ